MRSWPGIRTSAIGLFVAAVCVSPDREARGEEVEPSPASEEAPGRADVESQRETPATPSRRVVEEIVVTAQRREEGLRDVPISLSVLDDDFIGEQSLTDLKDLSVFVPNAMIDTTPVLPDFRIRGFGSEPLNRSFEQSVGLVVDEVPYGRQGYFQTPLFDIDRVEVLRGPQGTLFGKNTSAGLFNIVTKEPSAELTGGVALELGDFDRRRAEVAIGGPLIRNLLEFRVAGLLEEQRGFVENTTAAIEPGLVEHMGGRERDALRLKLGLPDLFGAKLKLTYERTSVDLVGAPAELGVVPEQLVPFFREWDPNADVVSGNFVGSINYPVNSRLDVDTFVFAAGYPMGGWEIDTVIAHSELRSAARADLDISPAPLAHTDPRNDDNPQTTAEIRFSSPPLAGFLGLERPFGFALGRTNFMLGVFYEKRGIYDGIETITVNPAVLAQFLAFQVAPSDQVPPLADFIGSSVPVGDLGVFDTSQGAEVSTLFFEERSDSIAGFGQLDWQLAEQWALEYAMRFTHEAKDGHWHRVFDSIDAPVMRALLGFEEFTRDISRSELAFTPKVALTYDWTEEVTAFASWARGFKAGGFNSWLTASGDDTSKLEFDAERVTAWELGTKTRLLGGSAALNLALFWMDLEDFQALTASPDNLQQQVVNAAKARARGVEADGTWLATDWLAFRGSLGFNDSEFVEFPIGDCAPDREDADGDGDPRCDLSGEPLFRTPKWILALSPSVTLPLTAIPGIGDLVPAPFAAIALKSGLNVQYQDVCFGARFRDPRSRIPSFFRFDGSIGFGNESQGWSLDVVAKNFTDKFTLIRRDDVVVSGAAADAGGAPGAFWQFVDPPRIIFGSFRWAF